MVYSMLSGALEETMALKKLVIVARAPVRFWMVTVMLDAVRFDIAIERPEIALPVGVSVHALPT